MQAREEEAEGGGLHGGLNRHSAADLLRLLGAGGVQSVVRPIVCLQHRGEAQMLFGKDRNHTSTVTARSESPSPSRMEQKV